MNFKQLEQKWLEQWKQWKTYTFTDDLKKSKFYLLNMFPYPSGAGLHVGHIKGYLSSDIYARYKRMLGFSVFQPMGWDAFGLPAEQYAISTGNHPMHFTNQNIQKFKQQLLSMGFSFHFSHEINTSDPQFFKTTQWIFSQMFLKGLAEYKNTLVNWSPDLMTVLSDEEIMVENDKKFSIRGKFPIESCIKQQWNLKITQYAEQLLNGLSSVDWHSSLKEIQKNWIGKEEKYSYTFEFKNQKYNFYVPENHIPVAIFVHQLSPLFINNPDFQGFTIPLFGGIPLLYKEHDFRTDDFVVESQEGIVNHQQMGGKKTTTYKIKDWIFSRQRYWGEPIPILFDKNKKAHLEKELPLLLPFMEKLSLHNSEWLTKGNLTRESSTMPNWAGSSWYYLAFLLKQPSGEYLDIETSSHIFNRWMPVDLYIGGTEHATSHLIYARFWYKFLFEQGIVPTQEPFQRIINQGMMIAADGTKMSKSKKNYITPEELIEIYGADCLRLHISFSGPTQLSTVWTSDGLKSMFNWLKKISSLFNNLPTIVQYDPESQTLAQQLIMGVEKAIESFKQNLGVSAMMVFINSFQKLKQCSKFSVDTFLKVLSFYCPFLAEELWSQWYDTSIFNAKWETFSTDISTEEILIQINNKIKWVKQMKKKLNVNELRAEVEKYPDILREIKKSKKLIIIPGHVINILQ